MIRFDEVSKRYAGGHQALKIRRWGCLDQHGSTRGGVVKLQACGVQGLPRPTLRQ